MFYQVVWMSLFYSGGSWYKTKDFSSLDDARRFCRINLWGSYQIFKVSGSKRTCIENHKESYTSIMDGRRKSSYEEVGDFHG